MSGIFILYGHFFGRLMIYFWSLNFALFHLTCYMFGLRLKSFQMSLNYLVRKGRSYSRRHLAKEIESKLAEFADLCRRIEKYNRFWKGFLGIAYYVHVFVCATLVFVVFFAPVSVLGKVIWFMVMVAHAICIAFLAYSGDIVSRKVVIGWP